MKRRWAAVAAVGGDRRRHRRVICGQFTSPGWFMSYAAYARGLADGAVQLASLEAIRESDQARALRTLERSLEETVLMLDAISNELSATQRGKRDALFERVRYYRQAHDARNPGAGIDARSDEIPWTASTQ